MTEYKIIINILTDVINGKNLATQFNHAMLMHNNQINNDNSPNLLNISKIKDLTYGIIRYYFKLNKIINFLVQKPIKEQIIKNILLIGLYEIIYTKKPEYAIVNELVNLSLNLNLKKYKNFINAILRNYIRKQNIINDYFINNNDLEYQYNFSKDLITLLKKSYPIDYLNIIQNSNHKPHYGIRINHNKISLLEYQKILELQQINYTTIDNKIVLINFNGNITKIPLFLEGIVSIQDINAQLLLKYLLQYQKSINNNENNQLYILDSCCAPGGKLSQILENTQHTVLAIDKDVNRLTKTQETLNRLSLDNKNYKLLNADATNLLWWDNKKFDIIIADVPCSASGTIKKNPDIKIHRSVADINNFVNLQRQIIINLWNTLKDGSLLIYITCSIFKEENQLNIEYFQQSIKDFKVLDSLQLLPNEFSDSFYYCIIKKEEL